VKGFGEGGREGRKGKVAQTMYTHVNKYKNNKKSFFKVT
jgi:hypothetical protein